MIRYGKRCKHCGSTDVVKDAFVEWSEDDQVYVLATIHDDEFCRECEESGDVIEEYEL